MLKLKERKGKGISNRLRVFRHDCHKPIQEGFVIFVLCLIFSVEAFVYIVADADSIESSLETVR